MATESNDQREREVCASLLFCVFGYDPRRLESITVGGGPYNRQGLQCGRNRRLADDSVWHSGSR